MPDKNQFSLDTVLELARQNVLSEGEAEANELADERKRQLDAIENVASARDKALELIERRPTHPDNREDMSPGSAEYSRALEEYDITRDHQEEVIAERFEQIITK